MRENNGGKPFLVASIAASRALTGDMTRALAWATILYCALLSAGCSTIANWVARNEWRTPRVVEVRGVESLCSYPPSWCVSARAERPVRILARDGDLFLLKKNNAFRYRETDGVSLVLDEQGDVVLLNGKAVSIQLSDKGMGRDWLRNASTEDLAGLRLLIVKDKNANDFRLLEKLAQIRPEIGLVVETNFPDDAANDQPDVQEKLDRVTRLITLFEPDLLFINSRLLSARFDALAPKLGKLKVLTTEEGPWDFLPRLPRLRTLTIIGGKKLEDLAFLRNATGLQELVLWESGDLKDITALADFPNLKKLNFIRGESKTGLDLAVLEQLPELAWLGFPSNTSQETFTKVISSHPRLQVVELHSKAVHDLSPLRGLRHLKAAILPQEGIDLGPLQDLKHLEYLGLHKRAFEGDAARKTEALEKALPNTHVAQASPFCLGSGWILFLLPALILLRILRSGGQRLRAPAHA